LARPVPLFVFTSGGARKVLNNVAQPVVSLCKDLLSRDVSIAPALNEVSMPGIGAEPQFAKVVLQYLEGAGVLGLVKPEDWHVWTDTEIIARQFWRLPKGVWLEIGNRVSDDEPTARIVCIVFDAPFQEVIGPVA